MQPGDSPRLQASLPAGRAAALAPPGDPAQAQGLQGALWNPDLAAQTSSLDLLVSHFLRGLPSAASHLGAPSRVPCSGPTLHGSAPRLATWASLRPQKWVAGGGYPCFWLSAWLPPEVWWPP